MICTVRTNIEFENIFGIGRLATFYNLSDEKEHIALIYKDAEKNNCPLVRIHSECLTGDVFKSAHCDCGDQLNESLSTLHQFGGILLYLRQEGRGIGLYNKIDAYALQAKGIDTFKANEILNFPQDLRSFKVAAEMLQALGVKQIKLLTNNPNKVAELEKYGIKVISVINTGIFEKNKNRQYLLAKQEIAGHNIYNE